MKRKGLFLILAVLLLCSTLLSCRSQNISEEEVLVLEAIFRSGLEMQDDPFVRAETLRVMALTEDPRLGEWAEPLSRDPDRMVRIAALRKLVQSGHELASRRALMNFTRGTETEQYQVLETVLRYGNESLRDSILERAQRSTSAKIRLRALEAGLLKEIDEARQSGDPRLGAELLPALGRYVEDEDPQIAARALRALLEVGQEERARRFIDTFLNQGASLEERRAAGRILVAVRAESARDAFLEILERDGAYEDETFGIPQQRIDRELVRYAILGMSALGDEQFARPTQDYRTGADVEQTLEVLAALAPNPSADAAVTLSTAMRDAHPEIRRRAIVLYGERADAQSSRLRGAMGREDFEAQKLVVQILVERFADEWVDFLRTRLQSSQYGDVEQTLEQLRTLIRTEEELSTISGLRGELEHLVTLSIDDSQQQARIRSMAGYVLMRTSGGVESQLVGDDVVDLETRYAYLEYLIQNEPRAHVELFRSHLFDDSFALRLMAAAGLARAFAATIDWPDSSPE